MCPFTELEEVLMEETLLADGKKLVLFNDDVHSFEFVIDALMDVCGHELLQAEQCTIIVHYKGKCVSKVFHSIRFVLYVLTFTCIRMLMYLAHCYYNSLL